MKALLDTHTFLWWNLDDPGLSEQVRAFISEGGNEIFFSAASAWEIGIKAAIGRLILPEPPDEYIPARLSTHNFQALPVQISHALHVFHLPPHHQDPFDRLLIAQCQLESLPILTADEKFAQYGVEIIWS